MREIHVTRIRDEVARLCQEASYTLPDDIREAMRQAQKTEESPIGQAVLSQLADNAALAARERMPYCQDTGMTVVFAEVGQECHIVGGTLKEAINEGVRRGYKQGYMRNSVVGDPFQRTNTGDNTPAIIHTELTAGDQIQLTVVPKGAGSENMSALKILLPGEGTGGVKRFVLDTVEAAGGKACPPLVVGVGVGGNFDKVTTLAKKAILRDVGVHHPDSHIAQLETELFTEINRTGIGPQGLGGIHTALWVAVETFPCHIASLPVAVNLQCHAARKKTGTI